MNKVDFVDNCWDIDMSGYTVVGVAAAVVVVVVAAAAVGAVVVAIVVDDSVCN